MENVLCFLKIPVTRRTSKEMLSDLVEALAEKDYFGNKKLKRTVEEVDIESESCARELVLLIAEVKKVLKI